MTEPRSDATKRADLAAQAWAEVCELLDLQLSPLGIRAMDALSPMPGHVVIDVGCGAGQSALQLAGRVRPQGRVIGIDIAPTLLELAKCRAKGLPQVSFLQADAQSVDLPDQSADGVFSRFGVMAFANPVAAFSNFRRILKPSVIYNAIGKYSPALSCLVQDVFTGLGPVSMLMQFRLVFGDFLANLI